MEEIAELEEMKDLAAQYKWHGEEVRELIMRGLKRLCDEASCLRMRLAVREFENLNSRDR